VGGLDEGWLMQEKRFYPERNGKPATEVVREIDFSTDPARLYPHPVRAALRSLVRAEPHRKRPAGRAGENLLETL
jgi:hypothetical protein